MKHTLMVVIVVVLMCYGAGQSGQAQSIIVAASDSTIQAKARADIICDGSNDEAELQQSITSYAPFGAVEVGLEAGNIRFVVPRVHHSVSWLPGTYNLSTTLVIPDSSDCVIDARGAHFNLQAAGQDAIQIQGMNRCRYHFGMIVINPNDNSKAALSIRPTANMPAQLSEVTYAGLRGPGSGSPGGAGSNLFGIGLLLDPGNENIRGNMFSGTDISGTKEGIVVLDAAGKCDTNWFWVSFIRGVLTCIREEGVNVERNVWNVNVDAWLESSEAIVSGADHGKWYVIMGTGGFEGINNALVLNAGAEHNVIEMHPPIDNYAWENNSGNTTNVFLSTSRVPYNIK